MTKTYCYKTGDGELFEKKEDAERHEMKRFLIGVLNLPENNIQWDQTSADEIASIIMQNFTIHSR